MNLLMFHGCLAGDHIRAAAVQLCDPVRLDNDGRRYFLNNRGAVYDGAGPKRAAVVDGRAHALARCAEDRLVEFLHRVLQLLSLFQSRQLRLVDKTVDRRLDIDDFNGAVALGVGVELFMPAMERVLDATDRLRVDIERVDIDGAFVHLANVPHVEAAPNLNLAFREPVACQMLDALRLDRSEKPI